LIKPQPHDSPEQSARAIKERSTHTTSKQIQATQNVTDIFHGCRVRQGIENQAFKDTIRKIEQRGEQKRLL
jgi:hypothetical protein